MASVVVDDHLLRDVLTAARPPDLDGVAPDGIATTGLWLFRLTSSLANPDVTGKLSASVTGLPAVLQAEFRSQLVALPPEIEVLPMRDIAWAMAQLQAHHRREGRGLSAAMVEALAAAHRLGAGIAVSHHDVGPNLQAAAQVDGIAFHVL
jgi:hypothetical protein